MPAAVIVHLIYRLDIGGLERVMLNCIANMQAQANFKHVVISLTDANSFAQDAVTPITVYCLDKQPGNDLTTHFRLFRLLKKIKPKILHSYNLSTIEYHPIARLAGVKGHIHAEHGRDYTDPQGLNKKHNLLRRLVSPFIDQYICVSDDLYQWLINTVGISAHKTRLIHNGIDTDKFNLPKVSMTHSQQPLRLGIIARLTQVKDHHNLLQAMATLKTLLTVEQMMPKLSIIGDGPLDEQLRQQALALAITEHVEFLGARNDIAECLAELDIFVLSSIAEGIPMTILEAMSASTPVIATAVGGVPEIISSEEQGFLVAKEEPLALAQAIKQYLDHPKLIPLHGAKARAKVLEQFSEQAMVAQYLTFYQALS